MSTPDERVGSISKGMHVVILSAKTSLLDAIVNLFKARQVDVTVIAAETIQSQDDDIKSTLKTVADQKGQIDAFLYLTEGAKLEPITPFLFAKHLSRYFHRSEHPSRKAFLVALSMDGAFGLSNPANWSPKTGALTGLVKSLHQEWPWVFTRIIDFSTDVDSTDAAMQLLVEWTDADQRLVEVGITKENRYTIEFDEILE